MEHHEWVGRRYKSGIDGQRIVIIGNSHWLKAGDVDYPQATQCAVAMVLAFQWRIAFFNQIAKYFGRSHDELWQSVVFANFLPDAIGFEDQKMGPGSKDQVVRGCDRFYRIVDDHQPHKVLVFSSIAWDAMPNVGWREGDADQAYVWGVYHRPKGPILAYKLRHPQGASDTKMIAAVRDIMLAPIP